MTFVLVALALVLGWVGIWVRIRWVERRRERQFAKITAVTMLAREPFEDGEFGRLLDGADL